MRQPIPNFKSKTVELVLAHLLGMKTDVENDLEKVSSLKVSSNAKTQLLRDLKRRNWFLRGAISSTRDLYQLAEARLLVKDSWNQKLFDVQNNLLGAVEGTDEEAVVEEVMKTVVPLSN